MLNVEEFFLSCHIELTMAAGYRTARLPWQCFWLSRHLPSQQLSEVLLSAYLKYRTRSYYIIKHELWFTNHHKYTYQRELKTYFSWLINSLKLNNFRQVWKMKYQAHSTTAFSRLLQGYNILRNIVDQKRRISFDLLVS